MTRKCSRRRFLRQAGLSGLAAGLGLGSTGLLARAQGAEGPARLVQARGEEPVRDACHVVIDREPGAWCGRPRECGIASFGAGELAVLYWRARLAPAAGAALPPDLRTGAEVVLRRSHDGGATWPTDSAVTVHSNGTPFEASAEFLCRDPAGREVLAMDQPGAMFFFGRSPVRVRMSTRRDRWRGWYTEMTAQPPPEDDAARAAGEGFSTSFQVRSIDRGQTWEELPLLIDPPSRAGPIWKDNHPLVTMPDGALIGVWESAGGLWLYGTECQGMTWQYLAMIAAEGADLGRPSCAGLVLLPGGRVHCYMVMRREQTSALYLSESDDCLLWSEPRPIGPEDRGHDTPWPLRLRDGRIVVIFARRRPPHGLAAIVSDDDGRGWSEEMTIRDDAGGPEIGWPAAVELDDGRIFVAYQHQIEDGSGPAAVTFVAGSSFALP